MSWTVVFRIRQYVKGSLWVLPMLGGTVGAVLAWLDVRLEYHVDLPGTWQYPASTATSALASIVASTVALLGFVVTISVLVVQLATGTLSPRFMRLWYRDRMQKVVLAAFTGTSPSRTGCSAGSRTTPSRVSGSPRPASRLVGVCCCCCSISTVSRTACGRSRWRRRSPPPAGRWSRGSRRTAPQRRPTMVSRGGRVIPS
jgi:hypothetical protein